jgi:hypothetical protein
MILTEKEKKELEDYASKPYFLRKPEDWKIYTAIGAAIIIAIIMIYQCGVEAILIYGLILMGLLITLIMYKNDRALKIIIKKLLEEIKEKDAEILKYRTKDD